MEQTKEQTPEICQAALTTPFYDLDEIKSIPILEVAQMFGVPITTKNGNAWGALRNENEASVKFYLDTNTYCDFGMGNKGGNVINLVATIKECSNSEAIHLLGLVFNLTPLNNVNSSLDYELSNNQYLKIGIKAEKATLNFDIDIEKYGVAKSTDFINKYDLSVNELKNQYPAIYENMLRNRAMHYVYSLKADYLLDCFNQISLYEMVGKPPSEILQDAETMKELTEKATELSSAEKILKQATKNTKLNYNNAVYNVEETIHGILNGTVSVEVGNMLYVDLKTNAKKSNGYVLYKELPYESYRKAKDLNNINHTAFLKYDKERGKIINIAYSRTNARAIEDLILKEQHSKEQSQPKIR